ncbi:ABC transporter permease [Amycolatopsis jejuensis]|uniref:ABC transporter permease n=1 Tax=Amycolatopsis jejuensis TaxID=330084 RepID=UPI0005252DFA|nr:ABC transporter permease [Amycolatopsis jejuensis]
MSTAALPGTRIRTRPPVVVAVAFAVVLLAVLAALSGTWFAPHDPYAQSLQDSLQGPSGAHWLGTDQSGRDTFSRILAGARTALLGPAAITLGALILGGAFGLLAGYRGGFVDSVTMRVVDLMYAFPGLLIAIIVVGVFGGGYGAAVGVLVVLGAPVNARLVRSAALEQRGLPYVEAARSLGVSHGKIMLRHIWPNILPLVVANSFLSFAHSLVALAGLSFLGLGVPAGAPDWGLMLSDALPSFAQNPLAAFAPGVALVALAVSMNLLGDWLYERSTGKGRAR